MGASSINSRLVSSIRRVPQENSVHSSSIRTPTLGENEDRQLADPLAIPQFSDLDPRALQLDGLMLVNYHGQAKCYLFYKERRIAFRVSVNEAGLLLWLQDVVTEKEWQTARLQRADFETAGSFLENGSLENYAKLFAASIRSQATTGAWSSPEDPINDRVLTLRMISGVRHFVLDLRPVESDPSERLHATGRELLMAHAHELTKTFEALEKARMGFEASCCSTTAIAVAPPTVAPSAVKSPTMDWARCVPACVFAEIKFAGMAQTLCITALASSPQGLVEFYDGARANIVFRKAGKYVVSISMGFYTNQITVPRGSPLFVLQDLYGVTLAANSPTNGCEAAHVVPLVHVVDVVEGETMVLRARNHSMMGGSVAIQAV